MQIRATVLGKEEKKKTHTLKWLLLGELLGVGGAVTCNEFTCIIFSRLCASLDIFPFLKAVIFMKASFLFLV